MLGSKDIIDTSNGRIVRSRLHQIRISLCFFSNLTHHSDEAIKCFLRLILRRLNHKRLMEKQWEIDGGGVIAIVQQTLGHIHRGHTSRLIFQTIEDKLMTAQFVDRQLIDILQRLLDIIGIQRSQWTNHLNILTTQRTDISISAHHHGIIALIGRNEGEELLQTLTYAYGT